MELGLYRPIIGQYSEILTYCWLSKVKHQFMAYWQKQFLEPWCARQGNSHFSRWYILPQKRGGRIIILVTSMNPSQGSKQEIYHRQNTFENAAFCAEHWQENVIRKEIRGKGWGQAWLLCWETRQRRICYNGSLACRNRVYQWDGKRLYKRLKIYIHFLVYVSRQSVGSVGHGLCGLFMNQHHELTLRSAQIINWDRNEDFLMGMQSLFCKLFQHIIERVIEEDHIHNMDETGFIQNKNSCKLAVSKGSRNVWSKYSDANFHITFVVCVSDSKDVAPPLLNIPGKRLNRDVSYALIS